MTTGVTISSLMQCPACPAVTTVTVTVSTDTDGAEIDGGLLHGSTVCDECGTRSRMRVRVKGTDQ
jgi:transcription elongation factor Elf1